MRQIIGLSGYARSGKDTVANILVDTGKWQRISFAAKLKEAVYLLNPYIPTGERDGGIRRLQYIIEQMGEDKAKDYGTEYRRLLQVMGTEVGRNLFGENFWVDIALKTADPDKHIVITDCRFLNEAQGVVDLGGQVWRIRRPGTGPVNNHPSETSLDEWDFDLFIDNDGTIEQLAQQIEDGLAGGV